MNVFRSFRSPYGDQPSTKFFSVPFLKTAIFVDFLGGKVFHNSILFDCSLQKVIGPRSYPEIRRKPQDLDPTRVFKRER